MSKFLAILFIRAYQIFLRRFHGRQCIYHPTCSVRSLEFFKTLPFWEAWYRTSEQIHGCRADYSLHTDEQGQVVMTMADGRIISEQDINPAIAAKLRFFHR